MAPIPGTLKTPKNVRTLSKRETTVYTPARAEMAAYDALPRELRQAIDGAWYKWSATQVARAHKAGTSTARLLATIAENDRACYSRDLRDMGVA
ncbi:MAG: DUF6525 family protein [Hyphomicrobiaceae bacterium]